MWSGLIVDGVITAVDSVDGIGIEHTSGIDVSHGCMEVIDVECGGYEVITSQVTLSVGSGAIESRSFQLIDTIGQTFLHVLPEVEGCVPCASHGIDVCES